MVERNLKIMLIASDSFSHATLNSVDNPLLYALRDLGYTINITVLNNLYNLIDKLKNEAIEKKSHDKN